MKDSVILGALKIFDFVAVMFASILLIATPIHLIRIAAAGQAREIGYADAMLPVSTGANAIYDLLIMPVELLDAVMLVAFGLFWYALFSTFGLYALNWLSRTTCHAPMVFAKVVCGAAVVISATGLLLSYPLSIVASLTAAAGIACGLSIVMRLLVRKVIHRHRKSQNSLTHVVIVGTNERAIALAKCINASLDGRCHLVGFVDQKWGEEERLRQTGHGIVSDFDGFQEFLRDRVVDEVIICTPLKSLYEWSSRIFAQCEQQGIKVLYGADLFTPQIGHSCAEQVGDQPMLMSDTCRQTGVDALIKRFTDICISTLAVVAFAPVMIAVAAAIKFGSPGPALFIQERVGLNKRRFRFYKFRTMVNDAEQRLPELERLNEVTGPVFKIGRDPRVTSVGRFLRKSSLDELPQLFNVLKGDMSLVGPRPLAVRDYRGITEDWQRRRLSVRPGITCLWQILGRSSIPFERWMELDLEYIDKWSLVLDIKILFRTVPAVLKGTGAS